MTSKVSQRSKMAPGLGFGDMGTYYGKPRNAPQPPTPPRLLAGSSWIARRRAAQAERCLLTIKHHVTTSKRLMTHKHFVLAKSHLLFLARMLRLFPTEYKVLTKKNPTQNRLLFLIRLLRQRQQ